MCAASNPLKIILVGDPLSGKTSFCQWLLGNRDGEQIQRQDADCDIISLKVKIDSGDEIPVNIFNIIGSKVGIPIVRRHYRGLDGFIIMFDLTNSKSYDHVIDWKQDLDSAVYTDEVPSMILANKCDLEKNEEIANRMRSIEQYSRTLRLRFGFETSTKTGENIDHAIQSLVRQIINHRKTTISRQQSLDKSSSSLEGMREQLVKIVVIGGLATGKSAIIRRYVNNTFSSHYLSTIGTDLAMKKIKYDDSTIIRMQIWDIVGQERFESVTRSFYKNAAGCLVVFDVTRPSTLTYNALRWKNDFDAKLVRDDGNPAPCLLLGNKCDLEKEGVIKDQSFMKEYVEKNNFLRWFETSAKANMNIPTAIMYLVHEIMKIRKFTTTAKLSTETIQIAKPKPKVQSRGCCD